MTPGSAASGAGSGAAGSGSGVAGSGSGVAGGGGAAGLAGATGLRSASLGVIAMLIVQYGLGIWVNIYAKIPGADHGAGILTAIGRSIAKGPVSLSLHAIVGLLLLVAALALVIRAATAGNRRLLVVSIVGLLLLVGAAINGGRFVGTQATNASLAMGLLFAAALVCYLIGLLALHERR